MSPEEELEYNLRIFKKELGLIENKKKVDKSKLTNLSTKCQNDLENLNLKAKKLRDQIQREAKEVESMYRSLSYKKDKLKRDFEQVRSNINSVGQKLKDHREFERSKFLKVKSKIIEKINLLFPEYRRAILSYWKTPMDRNKFRLQ